jgi:hypothetical protein
MTDLELTKACAEAMYIKIHLVAEPEFHFANCPYYEIPTLSEAPNPIYDPLHDDIQAMALVKKFGLEIRWTVQRPYLWNVVQGDNIHDIAPVESTDLNRAIVECVAKLKEKT